MARKIGPTHPTQEVVLTRCPRCRQPQEELTAEEKICNGEIAARRRQCRACGYVEVLRSGRHATLPNGVPQVPLEIANWVWRGGEWRDPDELVIVKAVDTQPHRKMTKFVGAHRRLVYFAVGAALAVAAVLGGVLIR